MNILECVNCGATAAFPTAVKEPYTCLTCQTAEPPKQPETGEAKAVLCKELLESLAETFDRRVGELQKWSKQWAEEPSTIRAMELVYADISRTLRAECEKLANDQAQARRTGGVDCK